MPSPWPANVEEDAAAAGEGEEAAGQTWARKAGDTVHQEEEPTKKKGGTKMQKEAFEEEVA